MGRRAARSFFLAALTAASLSCAHIERFEATPRNACAGAEVLVAWEAAGRVSLASTPALPNTGDKPSRGSDAFVVQQTTRFELSARRLLKDAEPVEVEVDVAPPRHTFGEITGCSSEERELRAELELTDQLSPGFEVRSVENVLERGLSVEKDGRSAELPSRGDTSTALDGLPVLGTWVMTSALRPGEDCDAARRSVRQRLSVAIHLSCGE